MTKLFKDSIKKSLIDGYNRHAVYFSSSRNRAWVEIDQTVQLLPKKPRILDLGCGNGRLLMSLPKDCQYLGMDFSKGLTHEAEKLYPGRKFVVADFTDSKTWSKLGQFDAIYMMASLHHVEAKYHKEIFQQCRKHLNPNGYLVITTWNLLQRRMWGYHLNSLWGKMTNGIRTVWVSFRDDFSRFHFTFDSSYLRQLCVDVGLVVRRCEYVTKGNTESWWKAENLILVAQKIPSNDAWGISGETGPQKS